MATANIYGFPNSKASSPRNGFSLSYDTIFNSPAGLILPCFVKDVKEGDRLKVSARNLTRTRAVNTSAFMSFDEKVDFFFVPYRLLWSAYNQWRIGTTQPRSTSALMQIGYMLDHPIASWSNLASFFNEIKTLRDNPSSPEVVTGAFSTTIFSFAVRMLDLLGYGLPPVPKIFNSRDGKLNGTDFIPQCMAHFNTMATNYLFNYFRLAAYQCIYMSAYRNEDFEELDPSYYNADSLFISKQTFSGGSVLYPPVEDGKEEEYLIGQSTPSYIDGGAIADVNNENLNRITFRKLFTPRFKNWRKDLFTTVKPTNGIVQYVPVDHDTVPGSTAVVSPPFPGTNDSYFGTSSKVGNTTVRGNKVPAITNVPATMDDIRRLSALDKFSRLLVYSDKDYSSLYESLFGVKVDEPDVPRYLGTFSSNIKISEVVATSAGTDGAAGDKAQTSVLGELAGKGIGSGESRIFDATFKEPGIVMGMHYIMPYSYYTSYRYDPWVVKASRYDYYYPSFDGLGLTPVYNGERSFFGYGSQPAPAYSSILGFNTRYHEYKQSVNEIHGTFNPEQSDSHWTLSINPYQTYAEQPLFKISPTCTNPIFGLKWDGSVSTDPFMCFFSFNVTKVSNMEAIGVPNV